ncbi:TetR/AcrR family transcriptional regulator [Streptosporangium sp. NPDC020072]|uniref:TetR/AcrR family transcriptional regulator n=1 Tax=Streptosporangium sp. NPDC020072 TaxID=3154788 RepID=UPI00343683FC
MRDDKVNDPERTVELLWRRDGAEARRGLSLGRIVRAGIELADAEGLAGLSMRKVAERLGFTTMSLYRHVSGREQLIDLMRDAVTGESPGTVDAGVNADATGRDGWRARLETCARQGWELRRRHPWLSEIRGGRHVPGPNVIAHYEQMLGVVAETGLPPSEVIAVAGLVGRFVDSEALLLVEAAEAERHSGLSEEEWWGSRDTLFEQLNGYPVIARLWEEGGYDRPEDPFEFGLARLLDGIELLVKKRYETSDETGVCVVCGTPVEQPASGRPRAYCSPSCRQRAYRRRKSDAT